MSKVIILTDTTDIPITQIGELSGLCWGSDCSDHERNYKRGLECIRNMHGRTEEFPQVYMLLEGYSARVIREYYTHIGGSPTRLQESTRYVDSTSFEYIEPFYIKKNKDCDEIYQNAMKTISETITKLEELGIKREDSAMLLPLGMETKVIVRTNLRNLIDMAHQRRCTRAYWEFQKLMNDIAESLAFYSDEWKTLVKEENIFIPKCEFLHYCPEKYSCGRKPNLETLERWIQIGQNFESGINPTSDKKED